MQALQNSFPLQSILAAPAASFARQRTDGYASSQELTAGTHQNAFQLGKEF
ncbi:MAG TPA: hypothetical protein VK694_02090 [Verrucomicrobiae bacterium]|nr:hypothetical protein [Verrucomicrobiae bacterium]